MSTSLTFSLFKKILCFPLLLLFLNSTFAQGNQKNLSIKKGIAYLNTGKEFKFKKVTETDLSFIFLTMNKTEVELEKFKISRIDKRSGNKGLRYALFSLGATYVVVNNLYFIGNFYGTFNNSFGGETVFISIALSIITVPLGGLVGLTQKRYKTVYAPNLIGNNEPYLELKATVPNAVPSVTLSYTF